MLNAPTQFQTTHWSVVLQAGLASSPERNVALEQLCRSYWQPVYFFARRRGYSDADAKDFTQQFFARLLAHNDFAGLDATKGKFRNFLLAAFIHFLANEHDRASAQKRGGGQYTFPLDDLTDEQLGKLSGPELFPPAKWFDKEWALTLLAQALARLKSQFIQAGRERQFALLKPFLTAEGTAPQYATVAQELGVAPASVPVLVHRLRQGYREMVRAEIAQTVASPSDLEEEMHHLFTVLNQ